MLFSINIYNENNRLIKMIGCQLEQLQEAIERNKSLIEKNQARITLHNEFIENSWNERGNIYIEEVFDGINSPEAKDLLPK